MHYCAQHDPQANRLLFILTSFRDVVVRQNAPASQGVDPDGRPPLHAQHPSRSLLDESIDPIGDLFMDDTSAGIPPTIPAIASPPDPIGRHDSNPSTSPHRSLTSLNHPPPSPNNPKNGNGVSNNNHQDRNAGPSPNSTKRQNSLDTFFDLARVTSSSVDGHDSLGGDEIDFEMLWQWPNSNGTGLTPGGSGSKYFSEQSNLNPV